MLESSRELWAADTHWRIHGVKMLFKVMDTDEITQECGEVREERKRKGSIILGQLSLTLWPFMSVSCVPQPVRFHHRIQGIMNRLLFHR